MGHWILISVPLPLLPLLPSIRTRRNIPPLPLLPSRTQNVSVLGELWNSICLPSHPLYLHLRLLPPLHLLLLHQRRPNQVLRAQSLLLLPHLLPVASPLVVVIMSITIPVVLVIIMILLPAPAQQGATRVETLRERASWMEAMIPTSERDPL
jgi:hypothetical protein